MVNRREYWSWAELEELWPEIGVAWDMSGLAGGAPPRIVPCKIGRYAMGLDRKPIPVAKTEDGSHHLYDDTIGTWLHSSWEIIYPYGTAYTPEELARDHTIITVAPDSQTGLRVGAACYVNPDGTVTTEPPTQQTIMHAIGIAISPTTVRVDNIGLFQLIWTVRELYPRNWNMEPTIVYHGLPHFTHCNTQRVSNGICDCRIPPSRSKEVVRR